MLINGLFPQPTQRLHVILFPPCVCALRVLVCLLFSGTRSQNTVLDSDAQISLSLSHTNLSSRESLGNFRKQWRPRPPHTCT